VIIDLVCTLQLQCVEKSSYCNTLICRLGTYLILSNFFSLFPSLHHHTSKMSIIEYIFASGCRKIWYMCRNFWKIFSHKVFCVLLYYCTLYSSARIFFERKLRVISIYIAGIFRGNFKNRFTMLIDDFREDFRRFILVSDYFVRFGGLQ